MYKVLLHPWLLILAALVFFSSNALACSTCKCGDPTITLVGDEKPYANRLRIGLDVQLRSETEGDPAILEATTDEDRYTLGFAYSLNNRLTLIANLPYVYKERRDTSLAYMEADGLGDIDIYARYNLQAENEQRHLYGVMGGLRLPTSEEVKDGAGNTLDIDVQPDAGATAVTAGGYYQYFASPWFASASASVVHFVSEGRQDFDPGSSIVGSLRAQYALKYNFAPQVGLDFRYSEKDHFSGAKDHNSGGFLGNLWLGIATRVGGELLLYAGAQIPVIDGLNGHQEEDHTLRLGFNYDFE